MVRRPLGREATMKFFMFLAIAAVIVGGVYHTEISDYFADLSSGSASYGGGSSVVGSMRSMGNSSSALIGGAGNALNR